VNAEDGSMVLGSEARESSTDDASRFGLPRLGTLTVHRVWRVWLVLACLSTAIHLVTLRISPPIWEDEVEIIELGRNALPGADTRWSTLWTSEGTPLRILNWVGPAFQEAWCRLTGVSEVGPRVSSLLGALAAATCLLGWLLARGIRPSSSLLAAALLLLDPVFAQSWRGARIDCWVFALALGTCWLIWRAAAQGDPSPRVKLRLLGAGACLTLAGFSWASAILLVPLVAHEVFVAYRLALGRERIAKALPDLLTLAAATVLTSLALILPIWENASGSIRTTGSAVSSAGLHGSVVKTVGSIARSLWWSPWIFGVGVLSLLRPANRTLLIAFLVSAVGVCVTSPYTHRLLYLLPFLLLGLARSLDALEARNTQAARSSRWISMALCVFVGWSGILTLGARTLTAWRQRTARSPDRITEIAEATVGAQDAAVYTPRYEFYYAGRRLGWRSFSRFDYGCEGEYYGSSAEFLAKMQYAILPASAAYDAELQANLRQAGLTLTRGAGASGSSSPLTQGEGSVRLKASGFGEYLFYSRPGAAPAASRAAGQ